MIFDRTNDDVIRAKAIIEEKVKAFLELSEEEAEVLAKGCVTIDTLNRIEQAIMDLNEALNSMRYSCKINGAKLWTYDELFKSDDFEKILNNCLNMKQAFFVYNTTPTSLTTAYSFQNFNNIEKFINDLQMMVEDVKANYRECGSTECGNNA